MSSFTLTNTAGDIDSAISRVVGADTTPTAASQNMVTSSGIKSALENLATSNTFTVNSFAPSSIDKLEGGLGALDSTLPTSAAVKNYVDAVGGLKAASFKRTAEFIVQNESYQTIPITAEGDPILSVANNIATIPAGTYLMWHSFQYKGPGDISTATYGMDLNINVTSGMSGFSGLGLWESGVPTSSYRTAVRLNGAIKTVTQPTSFRLQMRDDPSQNTYQQYIRNLNWTFLKLY